MASKNQKSAQARAAAQAQARAALKAKERRTTVIVIAVSVLVLAVVGGLVFFIVNSSKTPTLADVHSPAGADATGGILVGPADGTPAAPISIPTSCARFAGCSRKPTARCCPSSARLAMPRRTTTRLRSSTTYSSGTKYSSRSANAAAVVADQSPEALRGLLRGPLRATSRKRTPQGLSDRTDRGHCRGRWGATSGGGHVRGRRVRGVGCRRHRTKLYRRR